MKLFDSLEKYDDGSFYFDEKLVEAPEHQGPLSTTSSVVRGIMTFAAVAPGKLDLRGDKILGLARFFLGIGVPGVAKDLFYQIDSLDFLENYRVSVPLILSLPAAVLSLTNKDQLRVKVNTVLGSNAPSVTVKLVQAFSTTKKTTPVIENQEHKFDPESSVHQLDLSPMNVDVGRYIFVFRVLLQDPENKKIYATGGQTHVSVHVTGFIKVDSAEIAILDNDLGSIETKKKLDLSGKTDLSLSANHLQKLRLSFQLITPLENAFKPNQVFLKLKHESKVEHIFVVGNSGKQFKIILDFFGLVEKFYYLSGRYDMQLTVGDTSMAICAGFKETTDPPVCLSGDLETNECLDRNGGCWIDTKYNITACKDTFRGRVCKCPLVNGVQYHGDGYAACEAIGPARCTMNNGGCWSEIRNGQTFSACSESELTGCRCPFGFHGDGRLCADVDECKDGLFCQCDGCTCKNKLGGYDCKCKGHLLYIQEQDTCIGRNMSKFGWFLTFLVLAGVIGTGLAGYIFYKYRLRSYMDSEIMAIMSQYMPLDTQQQTEVEPLGSSPSV